MSDSLESIVTKKDKDVKKDDAKEKSSEKPPFQGYVAVRQTLKTVATS